MVSRYKTKLNKVQVLEKEIQFNKSTSQHTENRMHCPETQNPITTEVPNHFRCLSDVYAGDKKEFRDEQMGS
jgi:hypothetical protein